MGKRPLLFAIVISLLYLFIHLAIINDYGLSWDFHYHHYAGLYHLGLPVPSINEPPPVPFTPPDPRLTTEDPFGPFTQIIPTLSYLLFYEKLHILPFDSAYNLPSIIYGSLGVGLLFLFIYEAVGLLPALFSSIFLAFLPNYFGYLHNNMKDIPNAFAFTLSIYAFWRLVEKRRVRDLIFAIAAFAFAFNVKINSIFIPVICGVWFILIRGIGGIRGIRENWKELSYFALAPIAALALWWPFWKDPFGKLLELPKFYSLNTINIPVLLFGNIFRSGINIPWFYPFVYIGITTPLPILIAFVVGLFVCFDRMYHENQKYHGYHGLLILWFFVPLLRYLSPKAGAIDGLRHFMEVVYPLSAIAGVGAIETIKWIKKFRFLGHPEFISGSKGIPKRVRNDNFFIVILSMATVLSLIYNLIHFHPYQTSFYNSLIGGIKGAYGKFDIDFWGTPQREAMFWLNKNAPNRATIYIAMAQSSAAVYLRDDLRRNANSKNMLESDYVVINNKQSFFTDQIASLITQKTAGGKLVYTREIDGVPLVWVFKS